MRVNVYVDGSGGPNGGFGYFVKETGESFYEKKPEITNNPLGPPEPSTYTLIPIFIQPRHFYTQINYYQINYYRYNLRYNRSKISIIVYC